MKKVQLYHNTKLGKIKTWIIYTEGGDLIVEWGILNGKMQRTVKHCKPVNEGKSNELSAKLQAESEAESQIREKREEGYTDEIPEEGTAVVNAELDFENLPKPFCPSKPKSGTCPQSVVDNPKTYAQRKFNGNCIILKKSKSGNKIYSRTMIDLTEYLQDIPIFVNVFKSMKFGQMLNNEVRFFYNKTKKESTEALGFLKTQDADEALASYNTFLSKGTFECVTFDLLFDKGVFIGGKEYLERHALLESYGFRPPEIIYDWKKLVKYDENGSPKPAGIAEKEFWEGFVLRIKGKSAVTYTLNGKPDRAGAYKFKFMKEGDFIVTEVAFGESGEHADMYSKFHFGQYDKKGNVVDCGWGGPGKLKHEQLREYTEDIKSGNMVLPFVVEVEFREWTEKNHFLEHPVIQRVRFDKRPEECEYEE